MTPQPFTEEDIQLVAAALHRLYGCEAEHTRASDDDEEAARAALVALAEAGRLQPQPARVVQTWYRSTLPDGSVWCESSQPDEVRDEASIAKGCSFWKLEIVQSRGSWQPWVEVGSTPEESRKDHE